LAKSIPIWTAGLAVLLVAGIAVGGVFLLRPAGEASMSSPPQSQPPEFPRMLLQGQFAGPLAGTVIQRWRDPIDGTICYVYVPMVVQHTPAPSGYVQYGSNSIGSISCMTKGTAAAAAN
jgi:hypothetical protein